MKQTENKLRDTIKYFTFQFVESVEKMAFLHQEDLLYSKEQLVFKILGLIQFKKTNQLFQDYAKMFENSYDEVIKNQCFEKDLSMSIQNHSDSRQSQNESQNQFSELHKGSFDDSVERIKKQIFSHVKSSQVTKYNQDPQDIMQYVQNQLNECKKQEQSHIIKTCPNHKIQESMDQDQDSYQDNSDYTFKESKISQSENLSSQNIRLNTGAKIKKSGPTNRKKSYRSYTQEQKKNAVSYASQMGLEFASQLLSIPKKNISRWMRRKQKSDRIRGRKPGDPTMQTKLTDWITENVKKGHYLTQTEIRLKAKEYSGDRSFKASKGWLEKYFRRNITISNALNLLMALKRSKSIRI